MGRLTFGETIYLLLMGDCPTPGIGRLMEAMLVSFIDHGATPPSTLAARNTATTGAPLRACVAAGVLGIRPLSWRRHRKLHAVSGQRAGDRAQGRVVSGRRGRDRRSLDGDRRRHPRLRPPLPHARPARDAPVSDGAGTGSRRRAHLDDPRGRDAARHPSHRGRAAAAGQHRRRHRGGLRRPRDAAGRRQRALHHFTRAGHRRAGAGRAGTPAADAPDRSEETTSTTVRRSGGCRSGGNR